MELSAILRNVGISPAEYAVLWHVRDTVVQPASPLLVSLHAANVVGGAPPARRVANAVVVSSCARHSRRWGERHKEREIHCVGVG